VAFQNYSDIRNADLLVGKPQTQAMQPVHKEDGVAILVMELSNSIPHSHNRTAE
jgi:hypothetical protein